MKNYAKTASKIAVVFVGLMSFSVANALPPGGVTNAVPISLFSSTAVAYKTPVCTGAKQVASCAQLNPNQCSTRYQIIDGKYYQCKIGSAGFCGVATLCSKK